MSVCKRTQNINTYSASIFLNVGKVNRFLEILEYLGVGFDDPDRQQQDPPYPKQSIPLVLAVKPEHKTQKYD